MAVANSFRVMILLLTATVALSSCAKKDSSFKGRTNISGARDITTPAATQAANQALAANNISILDITKTAAPVLSGPGTLSITSEVIVNSDYFDVTTTHSQVNVPASASEDLGGIMMNASGICVSTNCSPYYLMLTFTKGNQVIQQKVLKKHFIYTDAASNHDYIITGDPSKPFPSVAAAVEYLNQLIAQQPADEEGEE